MRFAIGVAVAVSCCLGAGTLRSEDDAIALRKSLMDDNRRSMAAIITAIRMGDPMDVVAREAILLSGAARAIPEAFSTKAVGESKALPRVWEEHEKFSRMAQSLSVEAERLAAVATTGDVRATEAQFDVVTFKCGSCHSQFRKIERRLESKGN